MAREAPRQLDDVVVRQASEHGTCARRVVATSPSRCSRASGSCADPTVALRSAGNTVRWGDATECVERFDAGLDGYQIDRANFDTFLASEAAGARADVRLGANVIRVARDRAATRLRSNCRIARWMLRVDVYAKVDQVDCMTEGTVGTPRVRFGNDSA